MEYNVVYDVSLESFPHWCFLVVGFLFIIVSVLLVRFRKMLPREIPSILPFVLVGISVLVLVFIMSIGGPNSLASALQSGDCNLIEGVISDFHPMPESGHEKEWFIVGNERFEYSDYMISPGFNNTASHGGPIRKGLMVRIHYLGDDIAKLEIAKQILPAK